MIYTTKHTSKRGFTLIESLIAIAILSFSVIATFGVAQSGLQASYQARDQVTAFYLAQESIEYIRNLRDQNSIRDQHWLAGISGTQGGSCGGSSACYIDATVDPGAAIAACPDVDTCPPLRQDGDPASSTYGLYGYNPNWTPTKFTRVIKVSDFGSNEIIINLAIEWTNGSIQNTFQVQEILNNWQP